MLFVIVCALLIVKKSAIRESARGVTVISLILTPLLLLGVVLIPPPLPSPFLSSPELELLAPVFGFLLSMFSSQYAKAC